MFAPCLSFYDGGEMLAHTEPGHNHGEAPAFVSVVVIKITNMKQCRAIGVVLGKVTVYLERSSWSHPQARAGEEWIHTLLLLSSLTLPARSSGSKSRLSLPTSSDIIKTAQPPQMYL